MVKFKISIKYKNSSIQEILEIEAESFLKAEEKCKEIKLENQKFIEKLKTRNVYCSRIIENCEVCRIDWRDELKHINLEFEKKEEN